VRKELPFAKPTRGLIPKDRPKDRLSQFFELRRAFYHCSDLMKELESDQDPELIAPIFARASTRLSKAANAFADLPPEADK
jgi:hypothetical protein